MSGPDLNHDTDNPNNSRASPTQPLVRPNQIHRSNLIGNLVNYHNDSFVVVHGYRIHLCALCYTQDEYRYLLAGGTQKAADLPNPSPKWLSDRAWGDILTLSALENFQSFAADFSNHLNRYKEIFDSSDPHR